MVEEYKSKHGFAPPKPKEEAPPQSKEPRRYMSEADFKRLMKSGRG